MSDQPLKDRAEESGAEICDCGRLYFPKFSDGDYCRSCMMDKKADEEYDERT